MTDLAWTKPEDGPLVGLAGVSEIFVEGFRGIIFHAGIVKLNFFSTRTNPHGDGLIQQAAVTLAVPLSDLAAITSGLSNLLIELDGLAASKPSDAGE